MKKCTASCSYSPETIIKDALTELLRNGARDLIAKAVEAELETLLGECSSLRLQDGRAAVVRNGYLPGRTVQTGIGDVEVRVPKVRDRSGNGIVFNSALLPPYLKRAKNIEELLPWLYLKGISTGAYGEALESLLGENAKGLKGCQLKPSPGSRENVRKSTLNGTAVISRTRSTSTGGRTGSTARSGWMTSSAFWS